MIVGDGTPYGLLIEGFASGLVMAFVFYLFGHMTGITQKVEQAMT